MVCPKCGKELEDGKLLCENCGEEIKIVPDFDIELEDQLRESINNMIEDMAAEGLSGASAVGEAALEGTYGFAEEDIKDELRDYFPREHFKLSRMAKIVMALAVVLLLAAGITLAAVHTMKERRENSFDYQYGKAVEYAAQNQYEEAVVYLERALAINPEDLDARFLLAKYYDQIGQQQGAVSLLKELLDIDTEYAHRDEVYDMLLGIYEEQSDYAKMGELLKECDIARIVSKYNKYTALKPEFNKPGGVYDELISITLAGNAPGFVYYTLDGTVPTSNSPVYETPILLESGEYVIKAKFVNMYGMESDVETQSYYISLSAPEAPVVSLDSGKYSGPQLIEVYHDYGIKVYYTMDGSVPGKDSSRYTDPIEMPYGISNFSFIAVDESGLSSEVVKRTYHMEVQANFDTELALQVLRNNLWAEGKLSTVDGNVPNKLGINRYEVRTLFEAGESMYYIVYEVYVDTTGKAHDTSDIYAIDVDTADLYKAYKIDEGRYNLQPFSE